MPWTITDPMLQRAALLADFERGLYSIAELARRYGVSRKTAHKWIGRWQSGDRSTDDRSRAPLSCPHAHDEVVREAVLELRRRHRTWGPRKLVVVLARERPDLPPVSHATVSRWLGQAGLAPVRRRRASGPAPVAGTLTVPERANHVWTLDFKGHARLASGPYVYPLTVCDAHTRFVLSVTGHPGVAAAEVEPVLRRVFAEHGLPEVIRTDNGVPFVTPASPLGLTRLSAWWLRLGIRPERIDIGRPQQNGRHERMHRDLKAETMRPCAGGFAAQQVRFDTFRRVYNEERPHEALGQATPSSVYAPSPRPLPERVEPPEYPAHVEVRAVRPDGMVKLRGRHVFVSEVLAGERVGLEEVADGVLSVLYYGFELGRLRLSEV
jgi:transposase InsO family protein